MESREEGEAKIRVLARSFLHLEDSGAARKTPQIFIYRVNKRQTDTNTEVASYIYQIISSVQAK